MDSRFQRALDFKAELDALRANPTFDAATAWANAHGVPEHPHPLMPLAMVHKSRLHSLDSTDAQLEESKRWLEDNGFSGLLVGGALPLQGPIRDIERMKRGKLPLGLRGPVLS